MKYDVFISYSRKDTAVVDKIYQTLTADGLTCFIDRTGIDGGADFPIVITQGILDSRLLLFIASKNSYDSDFTKKELTFAVTNKGSSFIFPLIIDGTPLPKSLEFLLSDINWRSLSSSYSIEKELLAEVRKRLANPRAGQTLEMRRSRNRNLSLIVIALLTVLSVGGILYFQTKRTEAVQSQQAARLAADESSVMEAGERFIQLLTDARDSLSHANQLWNQGDPKATFEAELSLLEASDSLIGSAEKLRNTYIAKRAIYKSYFPDDPLFESRKSAESARSSRFTFWKERALTIYNESYQKDPDLFRAFLGDILDMATLLKADPQLDEIKTIIQSQ